MKLIFYGEVSEQGQLKLYKRKTFEGEMLMFAGKKVVLSVERKKKKRSIDQNRYYWKVVVPMAKAGLYDVGYIYTLKETHERMKRMFIIKEKVNFKTGEIEQITGSTTELTTTEMMEYFAQIQQWASEYLGVVIPSPNEQMEIQL
jgi:hypothetical protein